MRGKKGGWVDSEERWGGSRVRRPERPIGEVEGWAVVSVRLEGGGRMESMEKSEGTRVGQTIIHEN